jgi:hypothetical protein
MRCSYCKKEVPHAVVSCPHCHRATLQRVNYDSTTDHDRATDDGMGMVEGLLAVAAVESIIDANTTTTQDYTIPDTSSTDSFGGFSGGDSGGGGATGDF